MTTQTVIGYGALIKQLSLNVLPHYRTSFITHRGRGFSRINNQYETHVYPKTYALKDMLNPYQHLEFALKYDGINLEILTAVFKKLERADVAAYTISQPKSKYSRIIWFLYEFLLKENLNVSDCKGVKYVDVLDPEKYFTANPQKSTRHAVNNNLLGNSQFCPIVRRTKILDDFIRKDLAGEAKKIIDKYDPQIIARANHYLYTKETMSSYAIEREQPNSQRLLKFIDVLRRTSSIESLTKKSLIELQNMIVDARFADGNFRVSQNYVGENINNYMQKIHYISPKPEDVTALIMGLIKSLDIMEKSKVHPVIIASVISFGFVFIHPFEDGNGRLHRFLIHYVLSRNKFTPENIIFPISAVMLQNIRDYDAILESFSRPLLQRLNNYDLSDDGILVVNEPTNQFYRYIDYSKFSEYLFSCIEETIDVHFQKEIDFLINYDQTKSAIQNIIDMPDRLIDLFIRCIIQNNSVLAKNKRQRLFEFLSDKEVETLTAIVRKNMIT